MDTVTLVFDVSTTEAFDTWFAGLRDLKAKAKILARLRSVSMGNLGNAKMLGDGIGELKVDFGPGYRLYFARSGKALILLLNGGDRSSQERDVKAARSMWAEIKKEPG